MDISREDAKESLGQIQAVAEQTRKKIAGSSTGDLLILWGFIWIVAFIGTHFFLAWAWHIWTVLGGAGIIATLLICWWQFHIGAPTKTAPSKKIGWRVFWFWTLLYVYAFIWLSILRPYNGLQFNAFLCTAIMFAYVVMGLWFESYFMILLGMAVTGITLMGFYLIEPNYYCLWMAPTGGGALLGTGLYIRLCWR